MKELSTEEKAKAYDKAVAIVVDYYQKTKYNSFSNDFNNMEVLEKAFPELKESEDERMKNFISNELVCLRAADEKGIVRYNELTEAIAWLENKGEQKPVSNTLKEAFDKSKTDYSLEEREKASEYSESIIPTSVFYGESEEEYMLHKIIEAAFIAGQNNKQQSAWSKDDEERYLNCLRRLSTGNIEQPETVNTVWLKSIKDRVQPKQKLS